MDSVVASVNGKRACHLYSTMRIWEAISSHKIGEKGIEEKMSYTV